MIYIAAAQYAAPQDIKAPGHVKQGVLQIGAILFAAVASLAFGVKAECAFEFEFPEYYQPNMDGFQFEVDRRKTVKIARKIRIVEGKRVGLHVGENQVRLFTYKGDEYGAQSNELCVDVTPDFECSYCNAN